MAPATEIIRYHRKRAVRTPSSVRLFLNMTDRSAKFQTQQLKLSKRTSRHGGMIHDPDVYFSYNMNRRLKQMTSMDVIVIIRPAAVDMGECVSFLRASNIAGETHQF